MREVQSAPPGFLRTVLLLLRAGQRRAAGRRLRQQQMLNQRSNGVGFNFGALLSVFVVLFLLVLNGLAAFSVKQGINAAERLDAEQHGKIVVSSLFFTELQYSGMRYRWLNPQPQDATIDLEADRIVLVYGGSKKQITARLKAAAAKGDLTQFEVDTQAIRGIRGVATAGPITSLVGSLLLLLWLAMLTLQGEGLEMDVQRRRHPMWEWLMSHPVRPDAIFFAEMLTPLAANPAYWCAPLFWGILYGSLYGMLRGVAAAFLVGVPIVVAAACAGKALEIGITLRCSPRSRGAILGLLSWGGYAMLLAFMVGAYAIPKLVTQAAFLLRPLARLPWPWLKLFVGAANDGTFSFAKGAIFCWLAAGVVTATAIWFSAWATRRGLAGNFSSAVTQNPARSARFGREPLYRKELLWFLRDRSAVMQALLIPLSVAALQLFNLRRVFAAAGSSWNYLCGAAIFFGTYFLWVLGPKSLHSEGSALWISLTWPRGLESLLKAKARLWATISNGLVAIILCYGLYQYPAAWMKILIVAAAWYFFARSMAEKSVTLVTVMSDSGESTPTSKGQRWAAQLGMMTFAIGICTAQWQLAAIGVVYSYLTAAAMWQNFSARLPYLYDPWSEVMPEPPTLMHSMIAISGMVEMAAVASIPVLFFAGKDALGTAHLIGYALSALVVTTIAVIFLDERNVRPQAIWCWLPAGEFIPEYEPWPTRYGIGDRRGFLWLLAGAGGGLVLAGFALGYNFLLRHLPFMADQLAHTHQFMVEHGDYRVCYGIAAIAVAPFAEEYLFRGLLFRALDREWGGWKAIAGSAIFFAIYHPPISWIPVALVGAANALVFKRSGRLAPAVLLHTAYNVIVVWAS